MATSKDFKSKMELLESLLDDIQSENLDVDLVILKYKNAKKLICELQSYLKNAENEIIKTKLTEKEE